MEYPKVFDSCPNCGSTESFAAIETQEEIEKGNLAKDSKTPIMFSQTRIFNPKDNRVLLFRKQFPLLLGFYDVCIQCGTIYCKEMHKTVGVMDVEVKQEPPDIPPMFGRG